MGSLKVESRTHNQNVASSSLGPAGIVGEGGGVNVQRSLHPQNHDEVPLSKAPNPQLLLGRRSINGCPLLWVCVHGVCVFTAGCVCTWMGKYRARISSMGHHTWLYVTSLSLSVAPTPNRDVFISIKLLVRVVDTGVLHFCPVGWHNNRRASVSVSVL